MLISYKGQSINTKHHTDITEEERAEIEQGYYQLPPFEEVKKQFKCLSNGGVKLDKVTHYYFRKLMAQVQCSKAKWTVADVFENKELLGIFISKSSQNKKCFPDDYPTWKKVQKAISLGGKGYAKIPTQFPVKTADMILEKYNVNNKFYDYSCGWGARLISSLKHNIDYYGTDPNYLLCEKLNELQRDWKDTIKGNKSSIDIRAIGSESFVPEWQNTMGLAFSSPPYFDLEDYKIGKQSYTPGISYESWKNNYLLPTFENIYKYLIENGYFCLNIKDIEQYSLVNDSKTLAEKCGFKLYNTEILKQNKRQKSVGGLHNGDEIILIFKK